MEKLNNNLNKSRLQNLHPSKVINLSYFISSQQFSESAIFMN